MGKMDILSQLAEYKKHFAAKYGIEQLGIFGSIAHNEEHEGSDIDVIIKLKRPSVLRCNGIRLELERIFQKDVDLITLHDNQLSSFRKNVEHDAIYV